MQRIFLFNSNAPPLTTQKTFLENKAQGLIKDCDLKRVAKEVFESDFEGDYFIFR